MIVQQWKQQADKSRRIVAFGSSNTELSFSNAGRHNWVDWLYINLRKHVGNHVVVINQGIGGETVLNLLERIDRDVRPLEPSMVIVTIGGNDTNIGMPVSEYRENLCQVCAIISSYGAQPVLQTYYCPLYHQMDADYRERFEARMNVIRDLAEELDLPLVDQYAFFEPFYSEQPDEYIKLMRDRLHVNHLGNLAMGQYISYCFGLPALPVPEDIASEFNPLYDRLKSLSGRMAESS
ncbi:SGNH/GDSL hydrolase family protein [Paenibacillus sp. HB172176]|uniref:SGNH/GDSL hydrolase family protein n=1 Tax=Paenibacillus sp. HB172176 TaxID=2493690 RepID=UPI00143CAE17|nr:SGNH/GDSL hydrolase family protein [Paenibacillus sp. HB172176]